MGGQPGTVSAVAAAAGVLADGLAAAAPLIAEADIAPGPRTRRAVPAANPPWNAAVAAAVLDAHAGLRQLERDLRTRVTGSPGEPRGGSDANTLASLAAVVNLAEAISRDDADDIARVLMRWAAATQRLLAIDKKARWLPIRRHRGARPPRCPYCRTYSLRVAERSGVVMCFYPGPDGNGCTDRDGRQPYARLDLSRLDGTPWLLWADGVVQEDPEADAAAAPPRPPDDGRSADG
jgi:hypothetical protein